MDASAGAAEIAHRFEQACALVVESAARGDTLQQSLPILRFAAKAFHRLARAGEGDLAALVGRCVLPAMCGKVLELHVSGGAPAPPSTRAFAVLIGEALRFVDDTAVRQLDAFDLVARLLEAMRFDKDAKAHRRLNALLKNAFLLFDRLLAPCAASLSDTQLASSVRRLVVVLVALLSDAEHAVLIGAEAAPCIASLAANDDTRRVAISVPSDSNLLTTLLARARWLAECRIRSDQMSGGGSSSLQHLRARAVVNVLVAMTAFAEDTVDASASASGALYGGASQGSNSAAYSVLRLAAPALMGDVAQTLRALLRALSDEHAELALAELLALAVLLMDAFGEHNDVVRAAISSLVPALAELADEICGSEPVSELLDVSDRTPPVLLLRFGASLHKRVQQPASVRDLARSAPAAEQIATISHTAARIVAHTSPQLADVRESVLENVLKMKQPK